jgi:hypothetical protein
MISLCLTGTASGSCGRPNINDANDHAAERARATGVRQRVTIQNSTLGYLYFRIESVTR